MVDGEGKASADGDIRMTVRQRAKRKPIRVTHYVGDSDGYPWFTTKTVLRNAK